MRKLFVILLSLLALNAHAAACTKTVAAGASIQNVVSTAVSGDVVCLRGGTYRENNIWVAASRISIQPYPGETPVLDGAGMAEPAWATFFTLNGEYIKLSGITIKNGESYNVKGIWLRGANNSVRNMTIDNVQGQGILVSADNSTVENNQVSRASMSNKDCAECSPARWGFGIGSYLDYTSARVVKKMVIRGNTVQDGWGEGIQTFQSVGALVENNVVYDNFSVNLYVVASTGATVRNNTIYNTKPNGASGITLSDEQPFVTSSGNIVSGNRVVNADVSLFYWTSVPNTGLQDVRFEGNTLINGALLIGWTGRPPGVVHRNSKIMGNLFYRADGGSNGTVPAVEGVAFSRNFWFPTRPANAAGIGDIIP